MKVLYKITKHTITLETLLSFKIRPSRDVPESTDSQFPYIQYRIRFHDHRSGVFCK